MINIKVDKYYEISNVSKKKNFFIFNYCCPIKLRCNVESIKIGGQT